MCSPIGSADFHMLSSNRMRRAGLSHRRECLPERESVEWRCAARAMGGLRLACCPEAVPQSSGVQTDSGSRQRIRISCSELNAEQNADCQAEESSIELITREP